MAYTTIDKPTDYFETILYTGNGSSQNIGGLDFQPDWVWVKQRGGTTNHKTSDSVRGATKALQPNDVDAEATDSNGITAFNSDGFSLGAGGDYNSSSASQVAWNWKAGTSFTNDASSTGIGTIDSAGSFNNDAGFSIVTWSGNGSNNATIKHPLSAVPRMMLFKIRSHSDDWTVYHHILGAGKKLNLNDTGAKSTVPEIFNNTEPTSSLITFGTHSRTNTNGANYVGYIFAEKKGYSKFGSYTGNGNADGTFIYTGFKPAFLIVKQTDGTNGWGMFDNKRNPHNTVSQRLWSNESSSEAGTQLLDFLSNGFKPRYTNSYFNGSGNNYIYMAFAENPFLTSTGVPATAR